MRNASPRRPTKVRCRRALGTTLALEGSLRHFEGRPRTVPRPSAGPPTPNPANRLAHPMGHRVGQISRRGPDSNRRITVLQGQESAVEGSASGHSAPTTPSETFRSLPDESAGPPPSAPLVASPTPVQSVDQTLAQVLLLAAQSGRWEEVRLLASLLPSATAAAPTSPARTAATPPTPPSGAGGLLRLVVPPKE